MTQTKPRGRTPHGVEHTYVSIRIPSAVAIALHAIAKTKNSTRNKLISDILSALVNEVKQ
jgi:predicted transcriptional regulator